MFFHLRTFRGGILATLLILFLFSLDASAQTKTADVVGVVTDDSGASIPNVRVKIVDLGTNEARTTTTDSGGNYLFTLLPVSSYAITAEAPGFKIDSVPNVTLAVGDRLRLDLRLAVGGSQETVSVTAQQPALQSQTSDLNTLIDTKAVQDLPVNNRNFITLTQLAAGANNSPQGFAGGNGPDDRRTTSTVQVNGQYPWANNFEIDGMNNTERFVGTTIVKPSVEAIQEVQVQTNLYEAETGRTAGGVVNIITKSGTNQFHGSLYEYFRNDIFDASDVLTKKVSPYKQNQFGGSLGGPILKNRTFFFGDYEGYRNRQGLIFLDSVPTDRMRDGDFSDLLLAENGNIQVNDPVTGLPYAGNIIPQTPPPGQTGWDPVGHNIMSLYPKSTNPDRSLAATNFITSASQRLDTDSFDVKVDHRFSDKNSIFGRYSFENVNSVLPPAYPAGDGSLGGTTTERTQGVQLNYDHVFGPAWVMELRAGYGRYRITSASFNPDKNLSQEAGLTGSNYDSLSGGLAWFDVVGGSNLGNSFYEPELNTNNIYQVNGSVTHTVKAHAIKFGGELRRLQVAQFQSPFLAGGFVFVGSTGNSYADFLTGFPFGPASPGRQRELVVPAYRLNEESLFVQDDWRATTWLTFNMGLRYDYFSPISSKAGQMSNFDPETGQFLVAGENGVSSSAGVHSNWVNFGPRFGFAASLSKSTVLRGGFGISYVPPFMGSVAVMRNAPIISNWTVPTGWRLQDGMPLPLVPNSVTNPVGPATATLKNFRLPYVEQFNLTLQKELPAKLVGAVSYVGELGRRQFFPNNGPDFNSPANGQSVRPYAAVDPLMTGVLEYAAFGMTNYNALQATLERRFVSGFGVVGTYTWAHSFDDFDYQPTATAAGGIDFVLRNETSALDVRQRFTLATNYALPFARNATGLTGIAAKGWQLNLIVQSQTSLPFTLTNGNPIAIPSTGVNGATLDVPNQISDPYKAGAVAANPNPACHATLSEGGIAPDKVHTKATWFNYCAFATQPVGTWGNAGINTLYGPMFTDFDFSFSKDFPVTERVRLQFTGQAFNLFNHPNFQVTQTSFNGAAPNAGGLGQATSEANYYVARNLQFALKLTF
jgi:Carboxypeptidase regulatory-like domain